MSCSNRKGSALILVIIASMFLIVLTGALYTYIKQNASSHIWTRDRIQAKLSAEAGVNLATHMLVAGAGLPTDTLPEPILGTPGNYEDLPGGMGSVYVTVDPNNSNVVVTNANAYMLRCIAEVPGTTLETYGMHAIIMPENLARFSVFMDDPKTDGFYGDGYRFDGPFYANGPICIYSNSVTHENDPFFYSLQLTSDYYIYGTGGGGSQETTPAAGNLQMQPYNRLLLGPPYFEMGADPIPFGPDELNWQGVRTAAQNGGLELIVGTDVTDGSRLILRGDSTLTIMYDEYGAETVYDLSDLDKPAIWIENPGERLYLKGVETDPFDMALTIGMMGDLYMSGDLTYENRDLEDPDNRIILGLMTVYGDLIIADDPDPGNPELGWPGYEINTEGSFEYDAVLVSLDGVLQAENWGEPAGPQEFLLVGGYMIQEEGYTSTYTTGFDISVYFDPRLLTMHPPFFPTTANWNNIMFEDVPDIEEQWVTNGWNPHY